MPLYMDRHELGGATAEEVAQAHLRDLEVQERYGVKYLTYWFDYKASRAFCLADAPSKEAAEAVHREAHGLVGSDIIEVEQGLVEDFLGRIDDTAPMRDPATTKQESGLRTIMFTDMGSSTALTQRLGDSAAMELLRTHDHIIREALAAHAGREVKHTGDGLMASFGSVSRAVESSIAIQRSLHAHNEENPGTPIKVRIGLNAGEPVDEHSDLFGAAVQLARRICDSSDTGRILVSNAVRELALGKGFHFLDRGEMELKGFESLIRIHEVRWQDVS